MDIFWPYLEHLNFIAPFICSIFCEFKTSKHIILQVIIGLTCKARVNICFRSWSCFHQLTLAFHIYLAADFWSPVEINSKDLTANFHWRVCLFTCLRFWFCKVFYRFLHSTYLTYLTNIIPSHSFLRRYIKILFELWILCSDIIRFRFALIILCET